MKKSDIHETTPLKSGLYFYHELELWQQDNHFIRSAYVKHTLSYEECLKSLTYLHNESINIYTHLIPAGIIGLFLILYIINSGETLETPIWIKISYSLFGLGAYTCLTLSALFHLFKSHSPKVCKFGNQCDYFGIVVMITFSLISVILFVFDDAPRWRNSLIVAFVTLGSVCTALTFDKKFSTPFYRPIRSFVFVLFGLSGIVPIIISANIFGLRVAVHRSSAGWLAMEGVFYILGAVLYAARIPERLSYKKENHGKKVPGKYDLIGHLHQIFHIMVLIAALCHFRALLDCHTRWQNRNFS